MNRRELLRRLLEGHRGNVKFNDFIGVVEDFGFTLDRQRGSHRIYRHPVVRQKLNLQPRKGEAKPKQVDQFLSAVAEHQLESPYGRADD